MEYRDLEINNIEIAQFTAKLVLISWHKGCFALIDNVRGVFQA